MIASIYTILHLSDHFQDVDAHPLSHTHIFTESVRMSLLDVAMLRNANECSLVDK